MHHQFQDKRSLSSRDESVARPGARVGSGCLWALQARQLWSLCALAGGEFGYPRNCAAGGCLVARTWAAMRSFSYSSRLTGARPGSAIQDASMVPEK